MENLEEKGQRYLDFDTEVSTQLIDQSIKSIGQTGHLCLVYRLIVFLLDMLGVERRFERSGPQVEDFRFLKFFNKYNLETFSPFHQLH
jgi:hypothetical protein